jgi:membrane carboxypeptidase/penicillin-binding protein
MLYLTGSQAALPIWLAFMRQAEKHRPELLAGDFKQPGGLLELPVDVTTGQRATTACPEYRSEFFLEDRLPEDLCFIHPGPALELPDPDAIPEGIEPPPGPPPSGPTTRALRVSEKPKG